MKLLFHFLVARTISNKKSAVRPIPDLFQTNCYSFGYNLSFTSETYFFFPLALTFLNFIMIWIHLFLLLPLKEHFQAENSCPFLIQPLTLFTASLQSSVTSRMQMKERLRVSNIALHCSLRFLFVSICFFMIEFPRTTY
jgi:hypothetical protein